MTPRLTRLILTRFRSYARLDLALDAAMVVLTGPNGAGKTNVLEALSLLSPGKGLRRADLADMASSEGDGSFAVAVEAVYTDVGHLLQRLAVADDRHQRQLVVRVASTGAEFDR